MIGISKDLFCTYAQEIPSIEHDFKLNQINLPLEKNLKKKAI